MKRCPKCSRTYPDDNQKFCTIDGGLLVNASQAFDPNATIASSRPLGEMPSDESVKDELRDLAATIAFTAASTGGVSRPTGPTGSETVYDLGAQRPTPPPTPQTPPPVTASPSAAVSAAPPAKKSKLPLILGILLLLLLMGAGAVVALFFVVIKPRLDERQGDRQVVTTTENNNNTNANDNTNTSVEKTTTDDAVAPPNTVLFANSSSNLDGKLAEHYIDFSFNYPDRWVKNPSASEFVRVEKTEEDDKGTYLLENASVSWYNSNGTFELDTPLFADRIKEIEEKIAPGYPGYRRVSEGETTVNSLKAYEFRFEGIYKNTTRGDLPYWGRIIFIPAGEGTKNGAIVTLLATSLASDVTSAEDVGVKGETPVILKTFRFARQP